MIAQILYKASITNLFSITKVLFLSNYTKYLDHLISLAIQLDYLEIYLQALKTLKISQAKALYKGHCNLVWDWLKVHPP
jgi:hypothetical protein